MAGPPNPRPNGRFEKGNTGNPNGRPRKVKPIEASAFEVVLHKTLTVVKNGVSREITAEEALHHRTYEAAIAGSRMAQRAILRMIAKREKARAVKFDGPRVKATTRIEPEDPKNADRALLILDIASRKEPGAGWKNERDYLLLESWAVRAALARRRGGQRLDEKEINEVRRCTREPEKLRWPRKE